VSGVRVATTALCAALALSFASADPATGSAVRSHRAQQGSSRSSSHPDGKPVAPSGPPLGAGVSSREGENAGVPSAEGDQLVENGLGSPLCKGPTSGLSGAAQNNCQTSGFVGAPAPTNDSAFDVHIDVGAFGLSKGGLLSVIQDVFIAPVWNALVWVVHALVVMLEWCFTLELLDPATLGGLARSLRQAQASFTEPWLVLALATASMLTFYNGLIRRRVSETLGQACTTLAMMALGLWVIADPLGTVGAVGRWANQASLGTLGAIVQGTPASAPRTLADSMRTVFSDAIEMPWCYLEFGNVRWCSDPALLDPGLRKAALSLVAEQQAKLSCHAGVGHPSCTSIGRPSALAVARTQELVREADTNGELFLAFPANESQRNSVKDKSSLLAVLCQAEDDTKCAGPTAAQAEFRSDDGTFPRMIGVVLIAGGVLGMTMLLGLVALRLLAAALVSLFLLLLAPFAVLAPALGDSGRAVFGGWAARLLGSVVSKLIFSFLLGALLSMQRILLSLESLGWWTQWLLISAFWWAIFLKRHQATAFLQGGAREPRAGSRSSIARRIGQGLETPRAVARSAGWAKRKILSPAPGPETALRKRVQATRQRASQRADEQTVRTLERDHTAARLRVQRSPHSQEGLPVMRAQLERVRRARQAAQASGDSRRAAQLGVREQRVGAKLAGEQRSVAEARRIVAEGEAAHRASGRTHSNEQRRRRALFLDEQAALPPSRTPGRELPRRDYPALAGLVGYGREQYEQLAPRTRREARLRIDRELAVRSQLGPAAREAAHGRAPRLGHREQRRVDVEFDRALERHTHASGTYLPGDLSRRSSAGLRVSEPAAQSATGTQSEQALARASKRPRSRVMDDARAVAERRKRQLGYGPRG
jgi:hypothetical protein